MPVYPTQAEVTREQPWADLSLEEKKVLLMRLSQDEVGQLLNLSQPRISQMTSEGILPRESDGKYVLYRMCRAYWSYLRGDHADLRTPRRRY